MDGRGRFMDNIFIERLWRSIKYEEVHLKAHADGREARAGIGFWMEFYNEMRPPSKAAVIFLCPTAGTRTVEGYRRTWRVWLARMAWMAV